MIAVYRSTKSISISSAVTLVLIIAGWFVSSVAIDFLNCRGCVLATISYVLGVKVTTQVFAGYANIRGMYLTIIAMLFLMFIVLTFIVTFLQSEKIYEAYKEKKAFMDLQKIFFSYLGSVTALIFMVKDSFYVLYMAWTGGK